MIAEFTKLRTLAGAGAPADMVRDLRALATLSEAARGEIWTLLSPALNEQLPADMDRRLARFAEQHDLPSELCAVVVRAYRVLLRSAHAHDASPEDLAVDLDAIAESEEQGACLREAMLPRFPAARELLLQEATGGAVGDHGSVLSGVDWRLDQLVASTRGRAERAFVGMVTLHYRQGRESHRLTLQALPDTIAQLRAACDQMMRAAERAVSAGT